MPVRCGILLFFCKSLATVPFGIRFTVQFNLELKTFALKIKRESIEFSLNVSLSSLNSATKIFVITAEGLEPTISCVRDQYATAVPARHMWQTGSLNWPWFMLQWFIKFPEFAEFNEFLFHLGKTPVKNILEKKLPNRQIIRLIPFQASDIWKLCCAKLNYCFKKKRR